MTGNEIERFERDRQAAQERPWQDPPAIPQDCEDPVALGDPDPHDEPTALGWLRRPGIACAVVMIIAALVLLPRLGSSGLWDPQEVRLVDQAKDAASAPSMVQAVAKSGHPPLAVLAVALGLRRLGTSEMAARLPVALAGLGALGALFVTALWLGRRRAAPLAVLVLLTMPTFFLGARQVTQHVFPILAHILAVGGLVALCWPSPQPHTGLGTRLAGGLCAAIGLLAGAFSLGGDLGVAVPALAVAMALTLSAPRRNEVAVALLSALAAAALIVPVRLLLALLSVAGPALSNGRRLGLAVAFIALGALWLGIGVQRRWRSGPLCGPLFFLLGAGLLPKLPKYTGAYSAWVGTYLHFPPNREAQIDTVLKPLGFQLFPWAALLPLALAALLRFAGRQDEPASGARDQAGRATFAELVPLCWFVLTYLLCTYHAALGTEVMFPALGALALAAGMYLDRLLSGSAAGGMTGGVCIALLSILLGHDLVQAPEQYGGAHLSEALHWPAPLTAIPNLLLLFSLVFGVLVALGMAVRQRAVRATLLLSCVVLSVVATGLSVYGMVPAISRHVSYRGIYTKYKQLGGGELGTFGVSRSGSKFYGQSSVELNSIPAVFDFLAKTSAKRAFAMVGAQELGPLDQYARQHSRTYYVVDDSNVQFLLLSNQLGPGESDLNPLRRLVLDKEPRPAVVVKANFENKIELLGYDAPASVTRGDDFTIRLYFRVMAAVPGGYKVFIHFDGAGARWNGDHVPLDGKFPTTYWVPGTYIIDEHKMQTSRVGQTEGSYQMYVGFWPGGDGARLKAVDGPQDGENRVKLGVLRVK